MLVINTLLAPLPFLKNELYWQSHTNRLTGLQYTHTKHVLPCRWMKLISASAHSLSYTMWWFREFPLSTKCETLAPESPQGIWCPPQKNSKSITVTTTKLPGIRWRCNIPLLTNYSSVEEKETHIKSKFIPLPH